MLEYPAKRTDEEKINFTDAVKYGIEYRKAVVVLKPGQAFEQITDADGSIDIWTFSYEKGLLMLWAYFMKRGSWKKNAINLYVISVEEENQDQELKADKESKVAEFLSRYRLFETNSINVINTKPNEMLDFLPKDQHEKALE